MSPGRFSISSFFLFFLCGLFCQGFVVNNDFRRFFVQRLFSSQVTAIFFYIIRLDWFFLASGGWWCRGYWLSLIRIPWPCPWFDLLIGFVDRVHVFLESFFPNPSSVWADVSVSAARVSRIYSFRQQPVGFNDAIQTERASLQPLWETFPWRPKKELIPSEFTLRLS